MATINRYLFLLAAIVLGLGLLNASSSALGLFDFNGTILLPNGTGANGTNITVTIIGNFSNETLASYQSIQSWSVYANANGYFSHTNLNANNTMFLITMKLHNSWTNFSTNYTGPMFMPLSQEAIVNDLSNSTFYLIPSININITATNESANVWVPFNGMIIDEKLGVIADTWRGSIGNSTDGFVDNSSTFNIKWKNFLIGNDTGHWAVLPADRNYSVVVWTAYGWNTTLLAAADKNWNKTRGSPPRIIRITNTSNYPIGPGDARTITLALNLTTDRNTTESKQHQVPGLQAVNGTVKVYPGLDAAILGNTTQINFTKVIAYPFLREAGNLTLYDIPIDNMTGFDFNVNNTALLDGGVMFNISLLGGQDYILVAFANNSANPVRYAGFTNISVNKTNRLNGTGNLDIYIYVKPLAGSFYQNNETGVINTSMTVFKFANGDNSNASINSTIRVKVKTVYNGTEMNWVTLTNYTGHLSMPLWNGTAVTVIAYSFGYAPREYTVSAAELDAKQVVTIPLYKYKTVDPDTNTAFHLSLIQYVNASQGCNKPSLDPGCNITSYSGETELTGTRFKQLRNLRLNASLRVKNAGGFIVHYKSVEFLAMGAPDVDIDTSASSVGVVGDNYLISWKVGSKAPSNAYEYVLVGVPYEDTQFTDTGVFNVTLTYLYDDSWNAIWTTADQGINAPTKLAEYSTFNTSWFGGMTCDKDIDTRINTTQSCYVNTTSNYVWLHLPHFSGMMVQVKAPKVTTTSEPSTSGGSSAGGGGAGGGAASTYWSTVGANTETVMPIYGSASLPVASVEFTLSAATNAVKVTVSPLAAQPTIITTDPSGQVYKYFDITTQNIGASNLASAAIKFRVDKAWITENNVDTSTIKLARFTDKWEVLETKSIGEDAAYAHFEAKTPGFSTFVVLAQTTGGETVTTPASSGTTETATTTTSGQLQIPQQLQKPANIGILAAIIAVIALVGYIMFKKPSKGSRGRRKSAEE